MAKKSAIAKQKRRERLVALKWEQRKQLKKLVVDPTKSDQEREDARVKLDQLARNSSPVRLRNRCQLTGRPRGFLRKFRVSRICFRELASRGLLPGVTKSSW